MRPMPRKKVGIVSTRCNLLGGAVFLYGVPASDKEVCVMRDNIWARIELVVAAGVR